MSKTRARVGVGSWRWIYVVKHEYDGGGGFDWYITLPAAVRELKREQANIVEFAKDNWCAQLFPMLVPMNLDLNTDDDAITKLVSSYIENMRL